MSSKTVAVDLDPSNLLWLKARALAAGHRSMSEVLNEILAKVRSGGTSESHEVKSVVGNARICDDDPDLAGADAAIRALFKARSMTVSEKAGRREGRPAVG